MKEHVKGGVEVGNENEMAYEGTRETFFDFFKPGLRCYCDRSHLAEFSNRL